MWDLQMVAFYFSSHVTHHHFWNWDSILWIVSSDFDISLTTCASSGTFYLHSFNSLCCDLFVSAPERHSRSVNNNKKNGVIWTLRGQVISVWPQLLPSLISHHRLEAMRESHQRHVCLLLSPPPQSQYFGRTCLEHNSSGGLGLADWSLENL